MKLITFQKIYTFFAIFLLVLNISSSFSLSSKIKSSASSEATTDTSTKNKLNTSNKNKAQLEITFSTSNSDTSHTSPGNAKIMENIFTSKPIKIQARLNVDGVDNYFHSEINQEEKTNLAAPVSDVNLRFKQFNQNEIDNNGYQLKNLEVPEFIHKKISSTQQSLRTDFINNFKIDNSSISNRINTSDTSNINTQNFYEPQKLQDIENVLLSEFKNFIINKLHANNNPQRNEVLNLKNIFNK